MTNWRRRNADEELRRLERARASGDPQAAARFLSEAMRHGRIEPWRVRLASMLGDPASRLLFPDESGLDDGCPRIAALVPMDTAGRLAQRDASRVAGVAIARPLLDLVWTPLSRRVIARRRDPQHEDVVGAMAPEKIIGVTERLIRSGGDASPSQPVGEALYFAGGSVLQDAARAFSWLEIMNRAPDPARISFRDTARYLYHTADFWLSALHRLWSNAVEAFEHAASPDMEGVEDLASARAVLAIRARSGQFGPELLLGGSARDALLAWALGPLAEGR